VRFEQGHQIDHRHLTDRADRNFLRADHDRTGLTSDLIHPHLDLFEERRQKSHRRKSGRTDRKTLTCRGGGIPERVERVCALTNFFRKTRHFRITTRVISNRTISIGRERNTEG